MFFQETKRGLRAFPSRAEQKEEVQEDMNELRMKMAPMRKALVAAGAGAFSTVSASAAIACRDDVCWRVHERYVYPPSPTIVIHPDYWRPPTARIIIHPEGWRPVEHFTREYVVRDYYGYGYGYGDPDW
jgi:hypothetical protein